MPSELLPPSTDPGLDGPLWELQPPGDLFVAQIVNIAEGHRFAVGRIQLSQRASNHGDFIALFERGIGSRHQFVDLDGVGIDLVSKPFFFPASSTIAIDAEIAADLRQPRLEAGATIECGQCPEHFDEDLLCQILGLIESCDEFVRDVEDAFPVDPYERIPRRGIALETALNQIWF